MAPAILVTTILGLIRALEAFEIELILGVRVGIEVYSTVIHRMIEHDPFGDMAPASALGSFVLLSLLILVVFNKTYIAGREYATVTGRFSGRVMSLGRWRYPVFIMVALVTLVITFIPMGFLLLGTFMTVFGFFDIPEPWTLDHWKAVLEDPGFVRAFGNTLVVGLGSASAGVIFCSLLGYIIVRSRFALRGVLDFISWLPWSIPGILLGFGLLWTFLNTPLLKSLHGTTYLLMIAIIIKSMPFGVQFMKTITLQLGNELEEASRVCGGSWLRTYVRIVLPLSVPMLLVVALLIFNSAARDISTLILLGSANSKTLSLLMLDWLKGSASTEKAMVVGAIIVALVVVTAIIARAVGGRLVIRG
jgi:iron(III) transport system permease protein